MLKSIAHIGFTVENLDRSVKFYRDVLGLHYEGEMYMDGCETAALFDRPGCEARVGYLSTPAGSPWVELIEFTGSIVRKSVPCLFKTSISELCFESDDIDREYARLREQGVKFISPPQSFESSFGRSRAVYFYDPDGNILELIETL